MSKPFLTFFLLCSMFTAGFSQDIRLNLYSSYAFADKFNSYYDLGWYYEGKIQDGYQWGGGLEYLPNPEYGAELLYLRQDTEAPTKYLYNSIQPDFTNFDLGMNYIMVGGKRYLKTSEKFEGYAGLMAGVLVASLKNPDNNRKTSVTKFSWGIRAGGVVWATDMVGINLQAQLLSAVQSMGGGFYFGTGGAGAGLTSYSTIYQFSLGGGLVIKISHE